MNDIYLHNNGIIEVHIQSNNRIKDSACKQVGKVLQVHLSMEEEREEHIWAVHVVLLDIVSYLNKFEF